MTAENRPSAAPDAWRDPAAYHAVGITDPDEIAAWVAEGWTAPRARGWRGECVSPARASALRARGVPSACAKRSARASGAFQDTEGL